MTKGRSLWPSKNNIWPWSPLHAYEVSWRVRARDSPTGKSRFTPL